MRKREWQKCTDPVEMLWDVRATLPIHGQTPSEPQQVSLRRHRMFTLTAAQPALNRINHAACNAAAETGWRLAEGTISTEERAANDATLREAWEEVIERTRPHFVTPLELLEQLRLINVLALVFTEPDGAARNLIVSQTIFHPGPLVPLLTSTEIKGCCELLRDIFGDRGRMLGSTEWQEGWRTGTAVALAQGMYDSRDFAPMPILADALQDAGCDNPDILSHCRDEGATHVRGCWVVDLVLGKE